MTLLKSKGLNIANDIPKAEREIYRKLKSLQIELAESNIECRIYKTKLMVGDKQYEVEEAEKFLENIKKDKMLVAANSLEKIDESNRFPPTNTNESKKRVRQESTSPVEKNEKKIGKFDGKNMNNKIKKTNYITQYYNSKQTSTGN